MSIRMSQILLFVQYPSGRAVIDRYWVGLILNLILIWNQGPISKKKLSTWSTSHFLESEEMEEKKFHGHFCWILSIFSLKEKEHPFSFFKFQIVFLGMMLSSTFWGYVSDRYGRKQASTDTRDHVNVYR